jgi:hypothetical protein
MGTALLRLRSGHDRLRMTPATLHSSLQGVEPYRDFGYFIISVRTRSATANTNRQSMATVMANRIQNDLSSNRPHLLCVNTARRSSSGLRTDSPIFRADLRYRFHFRKEGSAFLRIEIRLNA